MLRAKDFKEVAHELRFPKMVVGGGLSLTLVKGLFKKISLVSHPLTSLCGW